MKSSKHSGYPRHHPTYQPYSYWSLNSSTTRLPVIPTLRPVGSTEFANLMTTDNKRKKRTPHEVQQLEILFAKTEYPDSDQRGEIAFRLGLTVRQVQIWFQNRRAKNTKRMKSFGKQDTHPLQPIPEELGGCRHDAATTPLRTVGTPSGLLSGFIEKMHQLVDERERTITLDAGKPAQASTTSASVTNLCSLATARASVDGDENLLSLLNESHDIIVLPCDSVSVGGWRCLRSLSRKYGLLAYICCEEQWVSVFVEEAGNAFKITIPFDSVVDVEIEYPPHVPSPSSRIVPAVGKSSQKGGDGGIPTALESATAVIHLSRSPLFYFQASSALRVWQRCRDWTENQQGTLVRSHRLQGASAPLKNFVSILRQEMAKSTRDIPQDRTQGMDQDEYQRNMTSQLLPACTTSSARAIGTGLSRAQNTAFLAGRCDRSFAFSPSHQAQPFPQKQRQPSTSAEQASSIISLAESPYSIFSASSKKIAPVLPSSTDARPLGLDTRARYQTQSQLASKFHGHLQSHIPLAHIERYQGYLPQPAVVCLPPLMSLPYAHSQRYPTSARGRYTGTDPTSLPPLVVSTATKNQRKYSITVGSLRRSSTSAMQDFRGGKPTAR